MPSPTTVYELIKTSFRKVGITTAGETPTADEANDAMNDLNDLLETMSLDNLFVWGAQVETFTTVPGQATRTIGPTGNYVTTRPVRISGAYCTYQGVDFPIQLIGESEYDAIALKTQTQPIIERMLYINDFPNGILTSWPVPSDAISLKLSTDRVLTNVTALANTMSFPPGYLNYMAHALAIKVAPEYGITPSQEVLAIASNAYAAIKRANKVRRVAVFDEALGNGGVAIWQTGDN